LRPWRWCSAASVTPGRTHGALIWLLVLGLLFGPLWPAPLVRAETDLDGLVSCDRPSGRRCDVQNNVLQLLTDVLGTPRQLVEVDVSWVRDRLPSLDQDDLICLSVERAPGGGLRATAVVESCGVAGTVNAGASTGSRLVKERGRPRTDGDDDDHNNSAPPLATPTSTPTPTSTSTSTPTPGPVLTGSILGIVRDALTGNPIAGAQVSGPTGTVLTDAQGQFVLTDLPVGAVTLSFAATGFVSTSRTLQIVAGQNPPLSVALAPVTMGGDIRIVLTWGAQPQDLDAHLSGPNAAGGRFHVSFATPNPVTYASLDRDDTSQFGPEVISFRPDPATGQFVAGEYRFWVQNFSAAPGFEVSNGTVTVTQGGRELGQFNVAGATGDPHQGIWQVVNLTVTSAGAVTLAPVQQFRPGDDTTVLTTK